MKTLCIKDFDNDELVICDSLDNKGYMFTVVSRGESMSVNLTPEQLRTLVDCLRITIKNEISKG